MIGNALGLNGSSDNNAQEAAQPAPAQPQPAEQTPTEAPQAPAQL